MKKHILLLAAGAIVTLAACTNSTTNTGTMTQAQQDSAVNARTAEQEAKMKASNDSMISATAKMRADSTMRADSMMNAQKGAMKEGTKAATTGTRTVQHTTKTTQSSSNGTNNTKSDNAPNSTITKEQQQQQKNKFNER